MSCRLSVSAWCFGYTGHDTAHSRGYLALWCSVSSINALHEPLVTFGFAFPMFGDIPSAFQGLYLSIHILFYGTICHSFQSDETRDMVCKPAGESNLRGITQIATESYSLIIIELRPSLHSVQLCRGSLCQAGQAYPVSVGGHHRQMVIEHPKNSFERQARGTFAVPTSAAYFLVDRFNIF